MPRAGLSTATVIERAADLLDAHGAESLNLADVAASFDVRIPSLYKHVDGVRGLQRGIMLRAKSDLAETISHAAVGRSREDAIRRISAAYRDWAVQHPGQYPLTVRAPAPDDADDVAVSASLVDVIFTVLGGYDLRDDDAVDATRFLRSALHGFVSLETSGAFELPVDRERSFAKLVDSVVTALAAWAHA
ncbi:TetR/AcrR family transcriptional regulator [Salinibacterium sp. SWN167]|uniref:TetR/AcrR family transcriptional regulator n=1 Tax=Salinibacterium sp. SWN167 TaxID=2792054 RepID=UPI0018CFE1F3|nr:TetR-like C-terminal domain-containing protein [Salinibacterium sp. SWN167]MBH0083883.1 WHG domain-containing protein [Salinibacterium sp. SWN167]